MVSGFYRPLVLFACLSAPSAAAWADLSSGLFPDPLPAHYRTGRRFTSTLEQPISGSWKGLPLRSILRRLSREREISILLDRRVDADQELQIETGDRPLRSAVDEIARATRLGVTQVGNCLVVAPPTAILRLRTLVALRESELARKSESSVKLARIRAQKNTITWNDLERPADIVSAIGQQFGVSIVGIEQIPHDLWAGATIPEATVVEGLSLVLNQFDLTFEWQPRESRVRLVPIPTHVAIERTYALRGRSPAQTLRELHSLIEGLDAEGRGNRIVVRGTLEQHEAVAAVVHGSTGAPRTKSKLPQLPIEKQAFMLQAGGVSLRELFGELKKQGLPIEYDAAELKKAGIDLGRKVAIDLPQLPAAEFLSRLLGPYGMTFRFERGAVVVSPK
jgi:hypothetical protein